MTSPDDLIEAFSRGSPPIRDTALWLRAFVREQFPEFEVRISQGAD